MKVQKRRRHRRKASKASSSKSAIDSHPCAIVVSAVDDVEFAGNDRNANRISVVSTSSAESAHSDCFLDSSSNAEGENAKAANAEIGTSTFYVNWD